MNFKRGTFRIWLVLSVFWIIGCAGYGYWIWQDVPTDFEIAFWVEGESQNLNVSYDYDSDQLISRFTKFWEDNQPKPGFQPNAAKEFLYMSDVNTTLNKFLGKAMDEVNEQIVLYHNILKIMYFRLSMFTFLPPIGLFLFWFGLNWTLAGFKQSN